MRRQDHPSLTPSQESPPRQAPTSIQWAVTIYQSLLVLCPGELRREYGADMTQIFRQLCGDTYTSQGPWGIVRLLAPTLGDLATGATAEYVSVFAQCLKEFWMTNRLRASAIVVFCAYIAFVVAGMGYQFMTDYVVSSGLQDAQPVLSDSFLIVQIGAVVALLAVLIGGLPVAFAAWRFAIIRRRWSILALFGVPVVAFAALVGYLQLIIRLRLTQGLYQADGGWHLGYSQAVTRMGLIPAHPTHTGPTTLDQLYGGGLFALFILGALASAWAVSAAIARVQLSDRLLRFTRLLALLTTLTMGVMLAATVVWGLGLLASAPDVFMGNAGVLATNTAFNWSSVIAVMGIATVVAIIGLVRGTTPRQITDVIAAYNG